MFKTLPKFSSFHSKYSRYVSGNGVLQYIFYFCLPATNNTATTNTKKWKFSTFWTVSPVVILVEKSECKYGQTWPVAVYIVYLYHYPCWLIPKKSFFVVQGKQTVLIIWIVLILGLLQVTCILLFIVLSTVWDSTTMTTLLYNSLTYLHRTWRHCEFIKKRWKEGNNIFQYFYFHFSLT
jgi:hypothetical protein